MNWQVKVNGHIIYECGICSCYHPWEFDGDCRDDSNRFASPEDYIEKIGVDANILTIRSMDDRIAADLNGEELPQ